MFLKGDKVKVTYCPTHNGLNGKLGTLMYQGGVVSERVYTQTKFGQDMEVFRPTTWEAANAFWTVDVDGYGPVAAFVKHDVEPNEDVIIVKAPIGWKELEGQIRRVEAVIDRQYRVRSARGLPVLLDVENIRPVKANEKVPSVDIISKEQIAQAAADIFTLNQLEDPNSDAGKLMDKLGINLADDASLTVDTAISFGFRERVTYPKGIEVGDNVAISRELAKKFRGMSQSELEDYLLRHMDEVDI